MKDLSRGFIGFIKIMTVGAVIISLLGSLMTVMNFENLAIMPMMSTPDSNRDININAPYNFTNPMVFPMQEFSANIGLLFYQDDININQTVFMDGGQQTLGTINPKSVLTGTLIATLNVPELVNASWDLYNKTIILQISYETAFGLSVVSLDFMFPAFFM